MCLQILCVISHTLALSSWMYTQDFPILCPMVSPKNVEQNCTARQYFKWCHICCNLQLLLAPTHHNALNFLQGMNGPRPRWVGGSRWYASITDKADAISMYSWGFQEIWISGFQDCMNGSCWCAVQGVGVTGSQFNTKQCSI